MEGADSTGHNFPTTKPHILSLKARKCPERIKPGLVTSSALPLLLSAKEGQRVVRRRPAPHRCAPPQATAFSPQNLSAECGRALHMRGATPAAVPLRKVRPSPTSEPSRAAAPPAPRFPGAAGHGRPGGPLPAFFSQNTQSLNRDEAMNFSQVHLHILTGQLHAALRRPSARERWHHLSGPIPPGPRPNPET